MSRPTLAERLSLPDAVLSRSDLAALGYGRRAVDHLFRHLPTVELPGSRRPLIRADEFRRYIEENTYRPENERVRG